MMIALTLLLQAAAQPAPDIEFKAQLRARSVTVEQKGEAKLSVTTSPDGGGNLVDVRAPKADGRKTLNNVAVDVRVEARIADRDVPRNNRAKAETPPPQ